MNSFILKLFFITSFLISIGSSANFISESAGNSESENKDGPTDFDLATDSYTKGNKGDAFKQWLALANKGHPDAQFNVAIMYRQGIGVKNNNKESIKWYKKAANAGNPKAQNNLGFMYEYGLGVQRSIKKARSWYKKAIKNGDENATQNLQDFQKK